MQHNTQYRTVPYRTVHEWGYAHIFFVTYIRTDVRTTVCMYVRTYTYIIYVCAIFGFSTIVSHSPNLGKNHYYHIISYHILSGPSKSTLSFFFLDPYQAIYNNLYIFYIINFLSSISYILSS